jgi:hypothetical protein
MRKYFSGWLLGVVVVVTACASPPKQGPTERLEAVSDVAYTVCESPRPQICTREYNPVCAVRDTGVRCVTTPCPSAEEATYATGCTACADPKVLRHRPGACDQ